MPREYTRGGTPPQRVLEQFTQRIRGRCRVSFEALLWAANDAPVRDVNEFAVLVTMAERADPDGCNSFPARSTIADRTHIDPRTVLRTLQRLEERGLIAKGDQKAAEYLRADRRPVVYDLLIPFGWFPNVERINKGRAENGRPPLTAQSRPPIVEAPAKARRSDLGVQRPRPRASERGVSESPRETGDPHGVSLSPERGVSQSDTGCLRDTRTSPLNQSLDPAPVAPSARSALDARRAGPGSNAREAGGFAASGKTRPRLTKEQRAAVESVFALLPVDLRDAPALAKRPRNVQEAVLEALGLGKPCERTAEQLVEFRVMPRWNLYWASLLYGRNMARPVGPLVAMLKRSPLCNDPRCDEHVEVDTGQPCRSCAGKREDSREERGTALTAVQVAPKSAIPAEEQRQLVPEQRVDSAQRVPVGAVPAVGNGAKPNEEYLRQRAAARAGRV
ncbi:helix-turn-helix domain-containing protein [Kitasatospora cinereorecta]|uniref:Helix-turn-helix domain-containing protein n=1 Tax=Kitasatospora cinereorecta TaxID=285560 RepID=A0ABW0VLM9_9ACTN